MNKYNYNSVPAGGGVGKKDYQHEQNSNDPNSLSPNKARSIKDSRSLGRGPIAPSIGNNSSMSPLSKAA